MECTKCHKILNLSDFSLKKDKTYYLHCDRCREKIADNKERKQAIKNHYENTKKNNVIECVCGKTFIAFRDYHISRHSMSKKHINYIENNKNQ